MKIFIASFEVEGLASLTKNITTPENKGFVYVLSRGRTMGNAVDKMYQDLKLNSVTILNEEYIYNFEDFFIEEFDEEQRDCIVQDAKDAVSSDRVFYPIVYAYE